jgi:hypothetical protein
LQVFLAYKKVGDPGEVVTEKQGFSIVDIHELALATPLSPFCLHIYEPSHRNEIFLVGHHQEVRRFHSPGLHHITPVSNHCEMSHNDHERHTSILFSSFLQNPQAATILIPCHQQALRMAIYWDRYHRAVRKWWRGEGGTEYGGKI